MQVWHFHFVFFYLWPHWIEVYLPSKVKFGKVCTCLDVFVGNKKVSFSIPWTAKEFDFLIISKPLRSVVQIEAKFSNSGVQRVCASEQLEKGFEFFQSTLPFPGSEDWHFVKTIYIGNNKEEVCQDCSKHVVGPESDLSLWWDNIRKRNVIQSGKSTASF